VPAFAIVYDIGLIVTWIGLYLAVGFPARGGWLEFVRPNLGWFGLMAVKIVAWPVTVGHWLYHGRRPSRWKAITTLEGREVRRIVRAEQSA
jgi:hypothetical protein